MRASGGSLGFSRASFTTGLWGGAAHLLGQCDVEDEDPRRERSLVLHPLH